MPFQICHPRFFFDFAYKDSGKTPQPWENSVTFLLFKDNTTHKFEISSVLVQWFWLLSGLCRVNVQWSSLWCLKHSGYEAKIKNMKRWKSMGTEPQYVLSGYRVYSMHMLWTDCKLDQFVCIRIEDFEAESCPVAIVQRSEYWWLNQFW